MDSCLLINDSIIQSLKINILNNPNDFVARLAFADRLEELRLFPRRSELIRIQLRIHNLAHSTKKCTTKNCEICKELLYLYYDENCLLSSNDSIDFPCYVEEYWVKYSFVSKLKLKLNDLLEHGKILLKEVPTIEKVVISDKEPYRNPENTRFIWTDHIVLHDSYNIDNNVFRYLKNRTMTNNNYHYSYYSTSDEAYSDISNACLLYSKE